MVNFYSEPITDNSFNLIIMSYDTGNNFIIISLNLLKEKVSKLLITVNIEIS